MSNDQIIQDLSRKAVEDLYKHLSQMTALAETVERGGAAKVATQVTRAVLEIMAAHVTTHFDGLDNLSEADARKLGEAIQTDQHLLTWCALFAANMRILDTNAIADMYQKLFNEHPSVRVRGFSNAL